MFLNEEEHLCNTLLLKQHRPGTLQEYADSYGSGKEICHLYMAVAVVGF